MSRSPEELFLEYTDNDLIEVIRDLQAKDKRIAKLEDALKFYAKMENYNEQYDGHIPVYWIDLKGKRAREALKEGE